MSSPRHFTLNPRRLPLPDPNYSTPQYCNFSNLGTEVVFAQRADIKYTQIPVNLRCSCLRGTGAATCTNQTHYFEQNSKTKRWEGEFHGVIRAQNWIDVDIRVFFVEGLPKQPKPEGEDVADKEESDGA